MVRYVSLLRLTEQGIKNFKKSTARAAAFREAAAKAGLTIEAQYWLAGNYDGLLIFNAPDEVTALRSLAALAAAGNVRSESLRAFDAQEFDAIAGK
jgi:uncharacterized protein with GYD domain